jgi:CheY-like chemotaxis protein
MPRVMIVEDDVTILTNLAELLRLSGLDVIEARDGQVAFDTLLALDAKNERLPRMVVSDLMMPRMDGFEVLAAIRAHASFKHMPFVLLSARSEPSDLQQAFALGADDYLVKPFEVDQLIDVIRYYVAESIELEKKGPVACSQQQPNFYLE